MTNDQLLLRNLHTFNVAAECLSFTLAAQALNLTQGAVSHRIKVLETELGFTLFVRGTRKLELTPEGSRFHLTLAKSLNAIFYEISEINSSDLHGELTIAVAPSFAHGWLIPRLADFKSRFPGFNLKVLIHDKHQDLIENNIDAAVYYGGEKMSDMHCQPLFEETYIPVCTAEYADRLGLFSGEEQALARANFLHAVGSKSWEKWLSHMTFSIDPYRQSYRFDQRGMEISAAGYSAGIAIGRYLFVKSKIEAGDLVTPFPGIKTDLKYSFICPSGTENRPKIKTFYNWLKESA
ncbi:LysR substrate-binding domain-containing protein [Vibrio sp. JC009]|uniref:LysR substrate-binding domain-containing protein n=1 Tax=Vibrio sp. JC009 TaxID=2912314 RepID=UPI0023B112E3|nr:LysR substrate-binding domain-containing protein [Vibrio sp. JC009]WED22615.1 LysR substrate-binding domain-containing protein [Vibrio sp. JC009]